MAAHEMLGDDDGAAAGRARKAMFATTKIDSAAVERAFRGEGAR